MLGADDSAGNADSSSAFRILFSVLSSELPFAGLAATYSPVS